MNLACHFQSLVQAAQCSGVIGFAWLQWVCGRQYCPPVSRGEAPAPEAEVFGKFIGLRINFDVSESENARDCNILINLACPVMLMLHVISIEDSIRIAYKNSSAPRGGMAGSWHCYTSLLLYGILRLCGTRVLHVPVFRERGTGWLRVCDVTKQLHSWSDNRCLFQSVPHTATSLTQ